MGSRSEKYKQQRRAYQRAYIKKHPEYARQYYLANRTKIAAARRKWTAANKARLIDLQRRRYAANPEKYREYARQNYSRHREAVLARGKVYRTANPEKVRAAGKRWRAANREQLLKSKREYERRRAGLPQPTRSCPAACELCGKPPTKGMTTLTLDHDHATGKFRGWLCHTCNRGLGMLGDTLKDAQRVVTYLERAE